MDTTTADNADDLVLARRTAAGDERALAALYERYADPLFAFVYHHLDGERAEAEEVWQETWLAALRALPAYRGRSRLFTWLCAIARHKLTDRARRRGPPVTALSELSPQELAALVDAGPLPEDVVLAQATRARVAATLGALPADYRAALVARYADERGVDEVARLLGKSYKATESLLSRARAAFRAVLGGTEGNDSNGA